MKLITDRNELLKLLPKGLVIAELGVFMGGYSEKILELAEPSKLYLIDIFGKGQGHCMGFHTDDLSTYFGILTDKYKDNPKVKVIKTTTQEFLVSVPDNELEGVYIDAEHSYYAVRQDLALSFIKIKSGGYIMGHDYEREEIKRAVSEFLFATGLEIMYLTDLKFGPQSFVILKK
jgi:hypothetical protein